MICVSIKLFLLAHMAIKYLEILLSDPHDINRLQQKLCYFIPKILVFLKYIAVSSFNWKIKKN